MSVRRSDGTAPEPPWRKDDNLAQQVKATVYDSKSNTAFYLRFAIVTLVVHGMIGALVLIAYLLGQQEPDQQLHRTQIEERIRPVARIATSTEQATAAMAALVPTSTGAGAAAVELSGERVAQQYCSACHDAGLMNAPRSHDAEAWRTRAQRRGGIDGLLATAISGINQMPPRGGVPQLSDAQLRAAIEFMQQ